MLLLYTQTFFLGHHPNIPSEPSKISVGFQHVFCMTQRLTTLPYNYWPPDNTLFAASLSKMSPLHLYLVGKNFASGWHSLTKIVIFWERFVKTHWKFASCQILECWIWIWWLKEKNVKENCAFLYFCKICQFQKLLEMVSY